MISPTTYPGQPGLWIDKWNKFTNVSTVTSCFCSLIHHRKQAQCGNSQQRPHSQAVIPTVRSPEINQPYPKLVRVLQVKKKNDSNQHLLYPNTELLFTWHHEGMQGISTPRIYLGLTPQLPPVLPSSWVSYGLCEHHDQTELSFTSQPLICEGCLGRLNTHKWIGQTLVYNKSTNIVY